MKLPRFTPGDLVTAARLALAPCLAGLAAAILVLDASAAQAAAGMFAVALVLLQAAPRMRNGDLLGLLLVFTTLLEWGHAGLSGHLDPARWQAGIAVAGAMALLLKVQHLRALAREDPCVPLRQLERRSALLGRTPARLPAAPRKDRAHKDHARLR